MNTYETIYLMHETTSVIGQMMFDMLSVIFAIIAAGFIMGGRLSKLMVIGISILSSVWVMPMLLGAYNHFRTLGILAETLTADKLDELGGLVTFIGSQSVMTDEVFAFTLIGSHAATFFVSLWFLNYSRRSQGLVSN